MKNFICFFVVLLGMRSGGMTGVESESRKVLVKREISYIFALERWQSGRLRRS